MFGKSWLKLFSRSFVTTTRKTKGFIPLGVTKILQSYLRVLVELGAWLPEVTRIA